MSANGFPTQFCLCGTEPGYPHKQDCPYPLFIATSADIHKWNEAREAKRRAKATQS